MQKEFFYQNNRSSIQLEDILKESKTFEEFEKKCPEDFLNEDSRIGDYLNELLIKYDKSASWVSEKALLHTSYVGLIINRKKNNPSRDALIAICFAIGTTFEEMQYLLKYAGHAPLYVRRKRDVVIWFEFMKKKGVREVNDTLFGKDMKMLTNYKE